MANEFEEQSARLSQRVMDVELKLDEVNEQLSKEKDEHGIKKPRKQKKSLDDQLQELGSLQYTVLSYIRQGLTAIDYTYST